VDFQSHLVTALAALLVGMFLEHFRSREWLKQEQWKYKREIYQRLIHAVSDYSSLLNRSRDAFEQDDMTRARAVTDEIQTILLEMDRLTSLAKVYASEETMNALLDLGTRLQAANQKAIRASNKDELRKVSDEQMNAANALLRQLAKTAKSDLEFD